MERSTDTSPISGGNELVGTVNVSSPPGTNAVLAGTLDWIGGTTNGNYLGYNILTQPQLYAVSSTQWRVVFENVYNQNQILDQTATNLYFTSGSNVQLSTQLSTSSNCQIAQDTANPRNSATKCYTTASNYGNGFAETDNILESYDSTGTEFHAMNGVITTSNFDEYNTSTGHSYYPSLSTDTFGSPPSCITSTGGTSPTITVNC